ARKKELERLEQRRLEDERAVKAAARPSPAPRPSTDSEPRRSTADKPRPGKTRVWHDRTGQFKVEAEFLGLENGKIKLHKTNGVIIDVPSAKMSPEDMAYVEKLINAGKRPATAQDDDNVPLSVIAERRNSRPPSQPPRSTPQPQPKKPQVDWFEFFLNAGCDIDDCTRYAASFNRDKIDEAIVGDIKESTLRSLGLREGDIIRVMKAIEKRGWRREDDSARKEQMRKDEELARQLQAQENSASPRRANTTSPAPNLFTGPRGALKNQTRRGRPPPSSNTAPIAVDVNALQTSSRGSTPQITNPPGGALTSSPTADGARPPSVAAAPAAPAPAPPVISGFDDDAWTPRPSSAKPASPAPAVALSPPPAPVASPPAVAPTPPPALPVPPAPPAPPAPAPAPAIAPTFVPTAAPAIQRPATTTAATTSQPASSEFDILAKIGQMKLQQQARPPSAPIVSQPTGMGVQAPASFQSGLGMGNSPVPVGQLLSAQQTGAFGTLGPRGPPAPIPGNQSLLSPLIPTNSAFNSFVPTRPGSTPTFGGLQVQPTGFQPAQPSFLQTQPTGFQPSQPSFLSSQPTGFQPSQPSFLQSQPTGFQPSQPSFMQPQQTGFSPSPNSSQSPPVGFQPTGMGGMFNGGGLQPQATGFQPSFQPQQQNSFNAPPSNAPPQNNFSAANVFASMKAGTFAGNSPGGPQSADKYDALRQPNGQAGFMQPQQTGFGFQPQQQFQPGFNGY
ncbi:cytoskeletal protein binding protein, partial [Ceratobasidium sp. UAMH 11750]